MNAERLQNGEIKISGKVWFDVFPEAALMGWIQFYDRMFMDYGHTGYKLAADALKGLPACAKGAE